MARKQREAQPVGPLDGPALEALLAGVVTPGALGRGVQNLCGAGGYPARVESSGSAG